MFNPVAHYGYLLPTVYLFMADIANPDLSVCGCRTWICLDITRFYEEQHQTSSGSAWPACPKTVNQAHIRGGGRFDTICTAVCDCCDSPTACMLCRLEQTIQTPIENIVQHNYTYTSWRRNKENNFLTGPHQTPQNSPHFSQKECSTQSRF